MEHGYGREGDSVRLAVANADHAIGYLLETIDRSGLKDSTTVIIVGDHGFSDIKQVLRPNVWIKNLGARFQSAGGSAFLYVQDPSKSERSRTTEQVKAILNDLPEQYKKLFRVFDRKKLDETAAQHWHWQPFRALYSAAHQKESN
jgi:predicted AlkP superfamily pyrophosphatase or phosphodiesterase